MQIVILESVGLNAMKLASRVAISFQHNECIDFLETDKNLIQETNICMQSETTNFCQELKSYVQNKSELFKKHEPNDRVTREDGLTAAQDKVLVDEYNPSFMEGHTEESGVHRFDQLSLCLQ